MGFPVFAFLMGKMHPSKKMYQTLKSTAIVIRGRPRPTVPRGCCAFRKRFRNVRLTTKVFVLSEALNSRSRISSSGSEGPDRVTMSGQKSVALRSNTSVPKETKYTRTLLLDKAEKDWTSLFPKTKTKVSFLD